MDILIIKKLFCCLAVATLLSVPLGCANPDKPRVPELSVAAPEQWQQADAALPDWSQLLSEPALQVLIEEAWQHNQQLQASAARWQAAREQSEAAAGALWPSVDLSLQQQRQGQPQPLGTVNSASGSVNVSWEVDLWGRLSQTQAAALFNEQQMGADWRWARLSLAAQVSKNWLDAIEALRQWQLAQERERSLLDSLAVIEDGFQRGIRPALDVYSARAELVAGEASRLQRQQTLRQQVRNLSLLLGRYPEIGIDIPDQLPTLTPLSTSLSANLLEQRPDLQAAALAVSSQQANVSVAKANRLPRINLSGSYGAASDTLKDVLSGDDIVWSLLGGIAAPLFQGGQLAAEQRAQQAQLQASIADYRHTALTAFAEVEAGLDNNQWLNQQVGAAQEAVDISQQAQQQAFERYLAGLENLNTWLQSQRSAFDRRSQLVTLEANLLKNRIDLHLALGGDFNRHVEVTDHASS